MSPMVASFGDWGGWPALTATGTVMAVAVAVGLQGWLAWRERARRPALKLEFDSHATAEENDPETGARLLYLRLAVTNAEGKETARDVEILIAEISEFADSPVGSGGRQVWLANPALAWANSLDPLPRMSVPPGATRYLDLGRWVQTMPPNLVLSVAPPPGSNRHLLSPTSWRIRLAVTVSNADATFWDATVSFGESPDLPGFPRNLKMTVEQVLPIS